MAERTKKQTLGEVSGGSEEQNTDTAQPSVADVPNTTRVEVNEGFLLTEVKGDSRYRYTWASTQRSHPSSYERLKRLGYEPVSAGEAEAPHADVGADGYYTTGDLVLMRVPRSRYEEIQQRKVEMFNRRLTATEDQLLSVGSNVEGVETSVTERGGSSRSTFYIANNPLAKK